MKRDIIKTLAWVNPGGRNCGMCTSALKRIAAKIEEIRAKQGSDEFKSLTVNPVTKNKVVITFTPGVNASGMITEWHISSE